MTTLTDLVSRALEENNYDGMVNSFWGCGCRKEDLMPCEAPLPDECQPGYLGPPTEDAKADGADWCIYACKQDRDNAAEKAEDAQAAEIERLKAILANACEAVLDDPHLPVEPSEKLVENINRLAAEHAKYYDKSAHLLAERDRLKAEIERLRAEEVK